MARLPDEIKVKVTQTILDKTTVARDNKKQRHACPVTRALRKLCEEYNVTSRVSTTYVQFFRTHPKLKKVKYSIPPEGQEFLRSWDSWMKRDPGPITFTITRRQS